VAGAFVQVLLKQKGIAQDAVSPVDLSKYKEEQYDKLADVIRENLDMAAVYEILEKGNRV
jgi:adenosylcobyric acid synthase